LPTTVVSITAAEAVVAETGAVEILLSALVVDIGLK